MNKENQIYVITPNLKFLTNRPEIIAEQTRLKTRDLLSEAIDSIHEYHDSDPEGAHIVTKLDDTDEETLLVGSAVAGNLFFDFGILVDIGRIDKHNLQGLYKISEEFVSQVYASRSTKRSRFYEANPGREQAFTRLLPGEGARLESHGGTR